MSAQFRDRRRKVRITTHLVHYYFPFALKVTYLDLNYTHPPLLSKSALFCLAEQHVIIAAITKVNQFLEVCRYEQYDPTSRERIIFAIHTQKTLSFSSPFVINYVHRGMCVCV